MEFFGQRLSRHSIAAVSYTHLLRLGQGLTCYTTYRIVKELYGGDYAREHYVDQWRGEVEDYYLNFYVRRPEYLEALPEAERLAISNSLSGMRRYSEMPLKILKAEELVGGEAAMDELLHGLFNRCLLYTSRCV